MFGSLLYVTEAAMSKRVLDCSLPDPDPSAALWRWKMRTMLTPMGMIPFMMSMNNHPPKHRRALVRHWRRNREDQIAHRNGRITISGRVPTTLMLRLCLLFVLTFLMQTRELATHSFLRIITIASGATSMGIVVQTQSVYSQEHHWAIINNTLTRSCVPLLSVAAILVNPQLWRCQSSLSNTFVQNIWQPITKPTTPSFLHETSRICFATPSKLCQYEERVLANQGYD